MSIIAISNLTVLLITTLELYFITLLVANPLKIILDAMFPFSQVNRSLTKDFNERQNFNEILQKIYYLKSKLLNQNQAQNDGDNLTNYFDTINTGVIIYSPKGKIIYSNQFAQKLLNKQKSLIFDYQLDRLTIENWIKHSQNTTIHNTHNWEELSAKNQQNQKRWYHVIANFQKGVPAETILLISDKTELYENKQNEFDFISFAAHELRGPITVIRGYLDILRNDKSIKLAGDSKTIIDRLVVSGNRLSGYVNNILNVAKFDQKHLKVFIRQEKIEQIFQEIYDDVKLRAETQNKNLSFEAEPNLPEIACDKSSLSQVFTNLIDNAIKYTNQNGQIKVKAYKKGNFVNIEVIDNGIGMPSSVVSNLFKRFYRSQRSKDSVGGTGIGLFISKAIIDSHGGYVTVNSIYKEGSTFTVGIPIFNPEHNMADNTNLIKQQQTSWIKNHGKISR